jgi:ABC-2 type transport system ATP-binding protein
MTTAYMDEAERCAEVHLLDKGRLVSAGEPRQLLEKAGARNFDELFLKMAEEQP